MGLVDETERTLADLRARHAAALAQLPDLETAINEQQGRLEQYKAGVSEAITSFA
ncbi:MAG: hypothetical protein JSV68_00925 [Anaerolineaceae bacterium]|nr:MAG: hypothetical protein JSV68_00925 [Anaerolineaceae bacterium]